MSRPFYPNRFGRSNRAGIYVSMKPTTFRLDHNEIFHKSNDSEMGAHVYTTPYDAHRTKTSIELKAYTPRRPEMLHSTQWPNVIKIKPSEPSDSDEQTGRTSRFDNGFAVRYMIYACPLPTENQDSRSRPRGRALSAPGGLSYRRPGCTLRAFCTGREPEPAPHSTGVTRLGSWRRKRVLRRTLTKRS